MTSLTFTGNPVHTVGELPQKGSPLPDAMLVTADLADLSLSSLRGKRVVVSIFPSIDTDVCAASVRRFNEAAAGLPDTVVVCVSKDLPFALGRFCAAEGIDNVTPASAFRSDFGDVFGCQMTDGPLAGLPSRAVVIADADGKVIYTQQVEEVTTEPDYDAALAALK